MRRKNKDTVISVLAKFFHVVDYSYLSKTPPRYVDEFLSLIHHPFGDRMTLREIYFLWLFSLPIAMINCYCLSFFGFFFTFNPKWHKGIIMTSMTGCLVISHLIAEKYRPIAGKLLRNSRFGKWYKNLIEKTTYKKCLFIEIITNIIFFIIFLIYLLLILLLYGYLEFQLWR